MPTTPSSSFGACAAFRALDQQSADAKHWSLRRLFANDPLRAAEFSVEAAGLVLDYSKNLLDARTLRLLADLARERSVEPRRDAMFSGQKINLTEGRAALHTALRAPRGQALLVDGCDVGADVHAVLERIAVLSDRVRSGQWRGYGGNPITDIVNIGIGGSDLGPEMVCRALRCFAHPRLNTHFVANVDGHALDALLARIQPDTTFFIVASKTFTTAETMMNAHSARNWFLSHAGADDVPRHFVAVSTNRAAVQAFGIAAENMFPIWDWVGGRYSVWSAVGLAVALAIGYPNFAQFLAGAHQMDRHFREAPLESNMPVLLALVGLWNRNFLGHGSISIAPYHQDLAQFPAYLQQLEMESNGKRVGGDGQALLHATCPVVWGDIGTNAQHAYFQLLHQGTDTVPVDFIAALKPRHALPGHHAALLANCFAQSEALMRGKSAHEARAELQEQGFPPHQIETLVPHKTFPGNRPSNTILMEELTPAALGALIALYEHKVAVQGSLWEINSFDQWGVEFGKELAKNIQTELAGAARPELHDDSTNRLISRAKACLRS